MSPDVCWLGCTVSCLSSCCRCHHRSSREQCSTLGRCLLQASIGANSVMGPSRKRPASSLRAGRPATNSKNSRSCGPNSKRQSQKDKPPVGKQAGLPSQRSTTKGVGGGSASGEQSDMFSSDAPVLSVEPAGLSPYQITPPSWWDNDSDPAGRVARHSDSDQIDAAAETGPRVRDDPEPLEEPRLPRGPPVPRPVNMPGENNNNTRPSPLRQPPPASTITWQQKRILAQTPLAQIMRHAAAHMFSTDQ